MKMPLLEECDLMEMVRKLEQMLLHNKFPISMWDDTGFIRLAVCFIQFGHFSF